MFEAEAERGMDPDVKALAAKSLPHIKSHVKTLEPIAQKSMNQGEEQESGDNGREESRIGKPGGRPIR